MDSEHPIGCNTDLLPEEICREVIAKIDAEPRRIGSDEAIEYAKRLASCYPNMKPHDATRYAANIVKVFSEYPLSICHRVIDPVKGLPGSLEFMPTVADLNKALKAQTVRRDLIRANAISHIKERARRRRVAEEEEQYKPGTVEERSEVVRRLLADLPKWPEESPRQKTPLDHLKETADDDPIKRPEAQPETAGQYPDTSPDTGDHAIEAELFDDAKDRDREAGSAP